MGPETGFADYIHAQKYRGKGEDFREYANRVASVLTDNEEGFFKMFRETLLTQSFLPGGRIQAAIGSAKHITAFNCFVSGTIEDSFTEGEGAIMARATQAAITMRQGGGIGYDFSTLRPRGALIKKLMSQSSGPIAFLEIFDAICRCIASSGHRRGAQMGVMRIDHPDIMDFIKVKQKLKMLTGFNLSVAVTDEFMECLNSRSNFTLRWNGEKFGEVDAQELWGMLMRSTWDWAEPGVIFIDTVNRMNNLHYCETIRATNPCVSGDTEILTSMGYERIDSLVDKIVTVWNGHEWSRVKPRVTGTNQEMLQISFSNGRSLLCTRYHGFYLHDGQKVKACELEVGSRLQKHEWPLIGTRTDTFDKSAYSQGFYSGDGWTDERGRQYIGLYTQKKELREHLLPSKSTNEYPSKDGGGRLFLYYGKECFKSKTWVPDSLYSLDYRLCWLAGLSDSDGHLTKDGCLQISSKNRAFLMEVGLMCNTLGITGTVSEMKDHWRLSISATDAYKIQPPTKRLNGYTQPQREAARFVMVTNIEEAPAEETVYCFEESLRHAGVFGGVLTAQCGEQPLPPFGACLLGSINLTKFLSGNAFDYDRLGHYIPCIVEAMDNVTNKTSYPLFEQEKEAHSKRRMGLGVAGLANTLEVMGLPYGTPEFVAEQERIQEFMRDACYRASVNLAQKKGAFPLFKAKPYLNGEFIKTLPEDIRDGIKKHGIRNSHLLSIAPTGTISLAADNISGGIEPVFSHSFERTVIEFDGEKNYLIEDWAFRKHGVKGRKANDLAVADHLRVQLTAQKYVDSAVSKTCNVGSDVTFEEFQTIYTDAHAGGAKGCTTYRADGERPGVLTETAAEGAACRVDAVTGARSCE